MDGFRAAGQPEVPMVLTTAALDGKVRAEVLNWTASGVGPNKLNLAPICRSQAASTKKRKTLIE